MEYKISGKKVKITDDIKNYVETKLGKLDKYFENPEQFMATVMIKTDGPNQVVEVTIPAKRMILRAEETNKEVFAAIDLVLDKLERQIRKNKTRMSKKANKDKVVGLTIDFEVEKEEKDTTKIVKRKDIELKPMSEEEAILQMNLIDHDFFLFRNSKSGEIEVIYKRKDGNYGLIKEK
ncbi:MAG: ribosome-associated translation inhibitor RaiA [Bacilli bacterium]|nr:ribosome-associated translation inhibitor RaiA [Bacilli bacterium]